MEKKLKTLQLITVVTTDEPVEMDPKASTMFGIWYVMYADSSPQKYGISKHCTSFTIEMTQDAQQFTDGIGSRSKSLWKPVLVEDQISKRTSDSKRRGVKFASIELYYCCLGNTAFHFSTLSPSLVYHRWIVAIITMACPGFKCLRKQVKSQAVTSLI